MDRKKFRKMLEKHAEVLKRVASTATEAAEAINAALVELDQEPEDKPVRSPRKKTEPAGEKTALPKISELKTRAADLGIDIADLLPGGAGKPSNETKQKILDRLQKNDPGTASGGDADVSEDDILAA